MERRCDKGGLPVDISSLVNCSPWHDFDNSLISWPLAYHIHSLMMAVEGRQETSLDKVCSREEHGGIRGAEKLFASATSFPLSILAGKPAFEALHSKCNTVLP